MARLEQRPICGLVRRFLAVAALAWCCASSIGGSSEGASILVYHRFGPAAGPMTVRTPTFRAQLEYLRAHHHTVVPLRRLVASLQGTAPPPPPGSVAITVDDGHRSVFTEMLPLVREYNVPVTLFIYPSAISNASYAMTWQELEALHRTGLFDIQSHTYWHPHFFREKRQRTADDYRAFTNGQLTRPRTVLRARVGVQPDMIAWPFGIWDQELLGLARDAGYVAGFTLAGRTVRRGDRLLALPRYLVTDTAGRTFTAMLPPANPGS